MVTRKTDWDIARDRITAALLHNPEGLSREKFKQLTADPNITESMMSTELYAMVTDGLVSIDDAGRIRYNIA